MATLITARNWHLRSLEADLADAEQDEGEVAADSVAASAVDKDCQATACELGIPYGRNQIAINIRWKIEQAEHPGKYHI